MLQKALDKDHYLLGTTPTTIGVDTIQGIITPVNISGLCSALPTEDFILYCWTYTPEHGHSIMDEVMWFCVECEHWYHLDCCEVTSTEQMYSCLQDYMEMPLLKGGLLGPTGTTPLVFSATQVVRELQGDEPAICGGWEDLLEEHLGCSADEFLAERLEGALSIISVEVNCPLDQPDGHIPSTSTPSWRSRNKTKSERPKSSHVPTKQQSFCIYAVSAPAAD
ncbi:hypothetical protein BDM02DRAFT_3133519 [Thelephora ganbajun]|uniref:Uncharacterized protein n=1 Tax=Thelephora ganbajun TaxID=370292 RepID=A0ACB6YWP4_THEGA|nr:hypothetical protein BDM02DRAFT_3133519 [Thelephora ganbajun]